MSLELITLGSSASMPAAGDACSGYLVGSGDTRVLVDCGTGVIAELQKVIALDQLSAIVISHFHPDHFIDLIPLRYGLRYGPTRATPPPVYLPPGGIRYLELLGQGIRDSETYFSSTYGLAEYDPALELTIGDLRFDFRRTTHDVPTYAMTVRAGSHTIAYTADTRESDDLHDFVAGADLLLCEATYPASLPDLPSDNHLTGRQAGELAARAGVGHLVLTHFWPGIERSRFVEEASAAFSGPVSLAAPGARFVP